jgi:hypothetical protein
MSILLTRPATASARSEEPVASPVAVAAALAGAASALIGLVVCASVALTGWFLADAGAHGDTLDAVGVGAEAWLAGHGSRVVVSGVPVGVIPLVVTLIAVVVAFRGGRWATGRSPASAGESLAVPVATFAGAYVVVAVVTCVLASRPGVTPSLGRAVLGALAVGLVAGGAGLAAGSGRLMAWFGRVPQWASDVTVGALTGVLALFAAGALLAGTALLLSFNEAATVMSQLHLGVGEALSYTVVMALFAPNAALLGVSYLLGPGFAFGAGTTVSPTAVSLGVVPAFPMLAALPADGPTPGWTRALLAVPVLAAGFGAGLALRRHAPVAHDLAAVRGAAAGFCAGVMVTAMVALAGGPLGTGRMAEVGAPVTEVLVFSSGLMGAGGLVGALVANWWQRRRGPRDDAAEDAADDGEEPTVEVLR